jgi:hypothetical protein
MEAKYFVYSVYNGSGVECYKRSFTLAEDGKITLTGDPVQVEPKIVYEEVGSGEEVTAAAESKNAEAGTPCSCHKTVPTTLAEENKTMTKDQLKAAVDALTDEQVATASIATGTPAAAAPAATAAPAAVAPAAEAAAPAALAAAPAAAEVTFASLMAAAAPEVREAFETSQRTLQAKKDATIAVLKASGRCDITDEKLKALSQAELDQLVKLSGVQVDRAAVDYSGQGAARPAASTDEIPAPPDMAAAITAARAKDTAGK